MRAITSESLPQFIWRTRYRAPDASPPERTLEDTLRRVARSVAAIERDPSVWADRYFRLLERQRFLPGGRILAGAGLTHQVTLFNCFVMGLIDDSITGIFDALKEGALTMQQGGGVGYDFSTLRPRGSRARTSGSVASGPVSFMHVWDAMCATILSTGARRGAMMATLRCDHPDIERFIDAKRTPDFLNHFNLSVLVTDALMQAVERDAQWALVFPEGRCENEGGNGRVERTWSGTSAPVPCRISQVIPARELWTRLCASAVATAEPGVLFIDRINAENNLGYVERLTATNPCAEEPLPPYGACNLGSINLAAFVTGPFTGTAMLDLEAVRETARTAVRFLDNVIDISRFPLFRQRTAVHRSRRIGLGITGLADALVTLGLRYDSEPARELAARTMCAIRDAAYEASVELATEREPFEQFDAAQYLERPFVQRLPPRLKDAIRHNGIRNSHLLAIAPAGTISLLAGNVSSGIEPIFRDEAERRVLDESGEYHTFKAVDPACAAWRSLCGDARTLPDAYADQASVSPQDQLLMQAALQPLVDGSISKTVALDRQAARGTVEEVFRTAYRLGLKGCTVFRPHSRPDVLREETLAACEPPDAHCCDAERETD